MIKTNNKDIVAMYVNGYKVIAIYTLGQLIWPIKKIIDDVLSCFYNGYWIDEYPWTDDTPWTD